MAVGRRAGFVPDRVTLLTDTTRAKGAGAVQDTYTLLRKGMRKLLKQMGYVGAAKRRGLAADTQRLVATYVEQERKADIDWSDPEQRSAQLSVLFRDAEAVLELAATQSDDAEVRAMGWLLVKILGDDIEQDDQGAPRLAKGTAPDRIISLTEPEMRHGRKSSAQRFDGFKVGTTTEQTSELILDIDDMPAAGSDGRALMPTLERIERQSGVTVDQVIADGAYGSGANRNACAMHAPAPVDLVAPLASPADPVVDKSAFRINLTARTATCPQGHTVAGRAGPVKSGLPTWRFCFPRSTCEACSLFARCVKSKHDGRSLTTHPYEADLQAADNARQLTTSKPPIACAAPLNANRPNWSTWVAQHPLSGPTQASVAAPVDRGCRQLAPSLPARESRNADLAALLAVQTQPLAPVT